MGALSRYHLGAHRATHSVIVYQQAREQTGTDECTYARARVPELVTRASHTHPPLLKVGADRVLQPRIEVAVLLGLVGSLRLTFPVFSMPASVRLRIRGAHRREVSRAMRGRGCNGTHPSNRCGLSSPE